MHVEREVAMDQIHFTRNHIVVDHLLQTRLVEISARRALKILEDFDRDGSILRSQRFCIRGGSHHEGWLRRGSCRGLCLLERGCPRNGCNRRNEEKNSDPADEKRVKK